MDHFKDVESIVINVREEKQIENKWNVTTIFLTESVANLTKYP